VSALVVFDWAREGHDIATMCMALLQARMAAAAKSEQQTITPAQQAEFVAWLRERRADWKPYLPCPRIGEALRALVDATLEEAVPREPMPAKKIAAMLTDYLSLEHSLVTPHYLYVSTREHVPREHWELLNTECRRAAVAHNQKVK